MSARQSMSFAAFGIAVAAVVAVSALAETDLTGPSDGLLFGDLASEAGAPAPPAFAGVQAWPCIDAPGCDRPDPGPALLIGDGAISTGPAPTAEASAVPLPAALTLLGMALSGAAIGLRARRRRA